MQMIDWNAWSHIVDAAQDPQHREAVQKFLAQAELSAEIPAALDEKFLAPMRTAEATGEQCAYLLCNLGFAALVTGSRQSAAFAMACGRIAGQLAPDVPDLTLRRLFLSAKGALVVALLTDQPHVSWDDVTEQCAAYLGALGQYLEALPTESIEGNAMAAYSFAGRALSRIADFRAAAYYDREVASLVAIALRVERQLPSMLVNRIWSTIIPGTDAWVFFREIGAAAELGLCVREESTSRARIGLEYIDEIISRPAERGSPRFGRLMRTRAELLLLSDRPADALEAARSLQGSPDAADRLRATLIESKLRLRTGDPRAAIRLLAQALPTSERAIDAWRAKWTIDVNEGHWTHQAEPLPGLEDIREAWGLEAMAAAELGDAPRFLGAVDRFGGFLADSFLQDRQQWSERLAPSDDRRQSLPDRVPALREIPAVEPLAALDEIFDVLGEGTALLHVARTEESILTITARRREGSIHLSPAPRMRNAARLLNAHRIWSRAHFDTYRHLENSPGGDAECATAFSGLLDEVGRTWEEVLQGLLEDETRQLVLVGDDLVDVPLHAARTGTGDERLIDRVPVTCVPSLTALRACLRRTAVHAYERQGIGLHCLADTDSHSEEINALAATLGTDTFEPLLTVSASPGEDEATSHVLQLTARLDHDARLPFDSVLRVGERECSLARLFAGLALRKCEVVSSFACESALPSMLRAPGLDLAAMCLAAGAGNVLASSWETKPELSSKMTQAFFAYWVAGRAPAAAFRDALLDLRSGRSSLPDHLWAGMRLVGSP